MTAVTTQSNKVVQTKLKATKCYNGHHKEKTKWTFWPTQYLLSWGGFTAQVPAPDAGAQADVPQRYSGSELNDLLDLSMQCVGWGRGGFKSRCQVAKRSSWKWEERAPLDTVSLAPGGEAREQWVTNQPCFSLSSGSKAPFLLTPPFLPSRELLQMKHCCFLPSHRAGFEATIYWRGGNL